MFDLNVDKVQVMSWDKSLLKRVSEVNRSMTRRRELKWDVSQVMCDGVTHISYIQGGYKVHSSLCFFHILYLNLYIYNYILYFHCIVSSFFVIIYCMDKSLKLSGISLFCCTIERNYLCPFFISGFRVKFVILFHY